MNAFEALVATIRQRQGYWVRSLVRAELLRSAGNVEHGHSERSEESCCMLGKMLRSAQHDVQRFVLRSVAKAEKRATGRHTTPRWEIDLVGYKGRTSELKVAECQSFLDSRDVLFRGFTDPSCGSHKRYRLFNDAKLRETVLRRLAAQLVEPALVTASRRSSSV